MNWVGAKSISIGYTTMGLEVKDDETPAFNFLLRVLGPVIYIIIIGVVLQSLDLAQYVNELYLITIYYWIIRLLYLIISNRLKLINWIRQVFYWFVSIGLSVWVYHTIEKVDQILPRPDALLEQFWILVVLFLYNVLNNIRLSNQKSQKRKNKYIASRYFHFKAKYDKLITEYFHNNIYEALTYSIIIYEDYNRPYFIRKIEYIRFLITKKEHTLGVMQVKTRTYIDDEKSLMLGMEKIKNDGQKIAKDDIDEYYLENPSWWVFKVAGLYNGGDDYSFEIRNIYDYLMDNFYKNTDDKLGKPKRKSLRTYTQLTSDTY